MPGQFALTPKESHAARWRLQSVATRSGGIPADKRPPPDSGAYHVQDPAENEQRAKPYQEPLSPLRSSLPRTTGTGINRGRVGFVPPGTSFKNLNWFQGHAAVWPARMASSGSCTRALAGPTCPPAMAPTTIYNRFNRWRKAVVRDRLMDAITKAHDGKVQMIDTSVVRVPAGKTPRVVH